MSNSASVDVLHHFSMMGFGEKLSLAMKAAKSRWPGWLGFQVLVAIVSIAEIFLGSKLAESGNSFLMIVFLFGFFVVIEYLSISVFVYLVGSFGRNKLFFDQALTRPYILQPVKFFFSLVLWVIILTLINVALALILPASVRSQLYAPIIIITCLITPAVLFYIDDCLARSRRFSISETIVKPISLIFANISLALIPILSYGIGLLLVLTLDEFVPSGYRIQLVFLLLSFIVTIPSACIMNFLLAVEYKQAKARLLLQSWR